MGSSLRVHFAGEIEVVRRVAVLVLTFDWSVLGAVRVRVLALFRLQASSSETRVHTRSAISKG